MHDYWVVNKEALARALEKFDEKEQKDIKEMAKEFEKEMEDDEDVE